MRNDAHPFLYRDDSIDRHIGEPIDLAAGPGDDERVDFASLAQSEVDAGIARRHVTGAALRLVNTHQVSGCELQYGTDAVAIGLGAHEKNFEPMIGCGSI